MVLELFEDTLNPRRVPEIATRPTVASAPGIGWDLHDGPRREVVPQHLPARDRLEGVEPRG